MKRFEKDIPIYKAIIKAHLSHRSAKGRVFNPNNLKFPDYGGRGIRMCSGFQNVWHFLAIMGPCDTDESLNRIDNDGHYSCGQCPECKKNKWPLNCEWATMKEQCLNRRSNVYFTLDGKTQHASVWAGQLGISQKRLHARRKLGWGDREILLTPLRKGEYRNFKYR